MRVRNLVSSVCSLTLAMLLLVACGQSDAERLAHQKQLLTGRWEKDDGEVLEFREFSDKDPSAWRSLGSAQQDGVVTISNPSKGPEGYTAVFQLTEKGMLVITVKTTLQPLGPQSSMNLKYYYAFESVSEDSLVIRFVMGEESDEYRRISQSD